MEWKCDFCGCKNEIILEFCDACGFGKQLDTNYDKDDIRLEIMDIIRIPQLQIITEEINDGC